VKAKDGCIHVDVNRPVCIQLQSIHEILFHVFVAAAAAKLAGAISNSAVVYANDNHLLKCDLIIQGRIFRKNNYISAVISTVYRTR
jgi:hypothetical protein